MSEDDELLTCAAVGAILGRFRRAGAPGPLGPRTVSTYLDRSKPGRLYSDNPFPEPDGYRGRHPYWKPHRAPEFEEWALRRTGPGVGGGRR